MRGQSGTRVQWFICGMIVFVVLQLGGAMAPAIKELSRWLDANSEYFVAPDWADVVKHSVSKTKTGRDENETTV